jgi:predicted DNA-binding transcriptional regulator YafY
LRKADRLFQLVNLIRHQQPVSAATLAEQLNVSVRSIYRYIDDLSVTGMPIYGEPGIGYCLQPGFELPPLHLSAEELDALQLAVTIISRMAGREMADAARSLSAKVLASLPEKRHQPESALFSYATGLSEQQKKIWDLLKQAISAEQWMHIIYNSLQGATSERTVYPLGLFYWGGKWTLGSWCALRKAYREFRVDMIQQVNYCAPPLELPETINIKTYIQHQSASEKLLNMKSSVT